MIQTRLFQLLAPLAALHLVWEMLAIPLMTRAPQTSLAKMSHGSNTIQHMMQVPRFFQDMIITRI